MSTRKLFTATFLAALVAFAAPAFAADADSDGLSDAFEAQIGTNPNSSDTDSDNLSDFEELYVVGSDPNMQDTDGDGIRDDIDLSPLDPGGTLDGGSLATFTGAESGTPYAVSGESPTDGRGVFVHDGRLKYSASVAKAQGVVLPFAMNLVYDSKSS